MMIYILSGLALLVYLIITFLIGSVLKLHGTDLWALRIGLALIGVATTAICLRYFATTRKKKQDTKPLDAGPGNEVQLMLKEAEKKLASARRGKPGYGDLPAVLVVGDGSSGKTTSIVHSGLEAELLAGQVEEGSGVAPTPFLNIWFGAKTILIEAAAKVLNDDSNWLQLIRRLQPGKLASVFSKKASASRAIVICVESATFVTAGGPERQMQNARRLRDRLSELSRLLGVNLPVYVLFTKLDEINFFEDYVSNLQPEEVRQVIGVTLPLDANQGGAYAENATRALTDAFDKLFFSFAAKRPEFLSRENNPARLPGTYEFPREFRKLRSSLVKFLVDLCRPNQLTAGPFLRGFYFCGVRSVAVNDVVAMRVTAAAKHVELADAGATVIFRPSHVMRPALPNEASLAAPAAREVPQWVFLTRFFSDVVLADNAALQESGSSVKTNWLRRFLLASTAALCALFATVLLLSYVGNRRLEDSVFKAAEALSAPLPQTAGLPSEDSLRRLEDLRKSLEILTDYRREGPPISLRWGLYTGASLYAPTRALYFDRFRQLLLGPTQAKLLTSLKAVPSRPGPDDHPEVVYQSLKAYLMTTSHHEQSTKAFLAPVLLTRLTSLDSSEPVRKALALKQFEFYSEELREANPYSSGNEGAAVSHARKYLLLLAAIEPVYQAMLTDANRRFGTINFNKKFPASVPVISDSRDVNGAYSKEGWSFVQDAIKSPGRYFNGEQWVLGEQGGANVDLPKLQQSLKNRYDADFISQWRAYLAKASVVPYTSLDDASAKLSRIASPDSPLLAMFCLASQNTGVESPDVLKVFKAVQSVVPATCAESSVAASNSSYLTSLNNLKLALTEAAGNPQVPSTVASQINDGARSALSLVGQMSLTFGTEPEPVRALLEAPITLTRSLLEGQGQQQLNAEGKQFCSEANSTLFNKSPFNSKAIDRATLSDLDAVFRPGRGQLWTFYDTSLSKILTLQGLAYHPNPDAKVPISENFLRFFNRAAAFSKALYPNGAADPKFAFSLKLNAADEPGTVHLSVDGQSTEYDSRAVAAKQFSWPGTGDGVRLSVNSNEGGKFNYPTWDGLWGAFTFFVEADIARENSSGGVYEWRLTSGTQHRSVTTANGKPVVVQFVLDTGGLPNIFQRRYVSEFTCVANVAKSENHQP